MIGQCEDDSFSRQLGRIARFSYDSTKSEQDNFIDLDIEHVEAYFRVEPDLISFLKELNFDIGVGGSYHADSLLFRALEINYLKLQSEDIEAFSMQFKFDMPVILSSYPSAHTWAKFNYDQMPNFDSQTYRWQSLISYGYNKFVKRPIYMMKIKAALPKAFHAKLLDNYDQDHAMILAEGTKVGIF